MPINLNTIIDSHPLGPPSVLAMVLLAISVVCIVYMKLFFDPKKGGYGRLTIAATFSVVGIFFFLSNFGLLYAQAQDARADVLVSSIQQAYGVGISHDIALDILSERDLPLQISHDHRVFTVDVLDDGSVVVTDSQGNLVNPK